MRINRIKFAAEMARADLNVNRLAELAGVSRGTVTAIKSGKSCSRKTAEKIATGLGVSMTSIVEASGEQT